MVSFVVFIINFHIRTRSVAVLQCSVVGGGRLASCGGRGWVVRGCKRGREGWERVTDFSVEDDFPKAA